MRTCTMGRSPPHSLIFSPLATLFCASSSSVSSASWGDRGEVEGRYKGDVGEIE